MYYSVLVGFYLRFFLGRKESVTGLFQEGEGSVLN